MTTQILSTTQNHIGIITLNNPEKNNALTLEMRDALTKSFSDFEKNPDIKIIILNANGKNFCAGADLNHMRDMTNAPYEKNLDDSKKLAALFYQIYACEKPTIACVQGKTIGGGLGLLSACDIAISTDDALFCFSEVKLGLVPATIAPFILQRIGYHAANYFMTTAELFDAEKAIEIKLINHITENKSPLDFATTLAQSIVNNDQTAMQSTKKWLQRLHPITTEQLDNAAEVLAKARCNETTKMKIRAFLKKTI